MNGFLNSGAVGMVEFNSIAAGMEAADLMIKTAAITPIFFKTVCPGKFVAAIAGDVAAVEASVNAGKELVPDTVVDWFVIPNIHEDVIKSMNGCAQPGEHGALGVIETFSVASSILAADYAVKASNIRLMEVRIALGLGGKAYVLLTGDVAAVQAAVDAGSNYAASSGLLVRNTVIPSPAEGFFEQIA